MSRVTPGAGTAPAARRPAGRRRRVLRRIAHAALFVALAAAMSAAATARIRLKKIKNAPLNTDPMFFPLANRPGK